MGSLLDYVAYRNKNICNILAATTFVVWDHCITFRQEEVELIWRTKWGPANVLFLTIRYLAIFVMTVEVILETDIFTLLPAPRATCTTWFYIRLISGVVLQAAVEILLALRLFAFYGRSKPLLALLCFLFVAGRTLNIIGPILANLKSQKLPAHPKIHFRACFVTKSNNAWSMPFWAPSILSHSIMFMLLIFMFIRTKKHTRMSSTHLLDVFVRDGAWAFALIFVTMSATGLTFQMQLRNGDFIQIWLYACLGACGSRLILNLRSVARDRIWEPSKIRQLSGLPGLSGGAANSKRNDTVPIASHEVE